MNYQQSIDYLYSRLPMFSRLGSSAIKKDLTNTLRLCSSLGNPQTKFKSIHVAGTNGKGSVSHMLASILQTAGYRTGLYTSPHLLDFRERIRINGEMISEEEVISFVERQKENIESVAPSFFEVTVAMAFDHFARRDVDIAVVEVGLGGRLDSTNIISPVLSVITNIGFDHMNILGSTLPEIASEKAGIIKPAIPVVIGEDQPAVRDVFLRKAKETGSAIIFASREWEVQDIEEGSKEVEKERLRRIRVKPLNAGVPVRCFDFELDLTGTYQLKNIMTVLSSVEELKGLGFSISSENIRNALRQVKHLTGLMGRWQILSTAPLIICDTGHNEDGIKEVLRNIKETPHLQLHFVLGMVRDKDIGKILALLPKDAIYYFCAPKLERAKPAEELRQEGMQAGLNGKAYPSVREALAEAKSSAGKDDLVFAGGSTFLVAELV